MENLILNKKSKVYIINEKMETVYSSDSAKLEIDAQLQDIIADVFKNKKARNCNQEKVGSLETMVVDYLNEHNIIIKTGVFSIKELISALRNVMYLKNLNGIYLYFDDDFGNQKIKVDVDKIINNRPEDFIYDQAILNQIKENDRELMKTGKVCFNYFSLEADGEQHIGIIQIPINDEHGDVWGSIGVYVDVAHYVETQNKLKKAAYMDDLTQVYNRHCFNDKLQQYFEEEKFPITLLMGDVDGLKIVNDSLGHLKGDELIRNVANILKTTCRSSDSVFRWGGDEFLLILPKSTAEDANHLINRIKTNCDEASHKGIPLSISLGAATINTAKDDVNKVIEEAEYILYKNKLPENNQFISTKLSFLNKLVANLIPDRKDYINVVKKYADILADALEMDKKAREKLLLAIRLNDIGKVGLPENIIRKRRFDDGFTYKDIVKYREHADNGYRIAKSIEEIEIISEDIFYQFENYTGGGYPKGLKGNQIPINARIIRIVNQLYYYYIYTGKSIDEAIEMIEKDNVCDPMLLEKIKENKDRFKKIKVESSDINE